MDICIQLFTTQSLCEDEQGTWYGPGGAAGADGVATCCDVNALPVSPPNDYTISPNAQWAVRDDDYKRLADKVKLEVPVLVRAGVRAEEDTNPKLLVTDITPLEEAKPKLPRSIRIQVPLDSATVDTVDELRDFCHSHRGEAKVLFDLFREGDFMVVMEAEGYNVLPDRAFFARVEELCGSGSVRVID